MSGSACVQKLVKSYWPVIVAIVLVTAGYATFRARVTHNSVAIANQTLAIEKVDGRVDQNTVSVGIIMTKFDAVDKRLERLDVRQEAMRKETNTNLKAILDKLP